MGGGYVGGGYVGVMGWVGGGGVCVWWGGWVSG